MQDPSEYATQYPRNYDFCLAGGNKFCNWPHVSVGYFSLWSFWVLPFPAYECLFTYCAGEYLRRVLYSSLDCFVQPGSTESCLVLPNSQIHLAILGRLLGSSWRSPLSALCPGISLKTVSLDNCRAHLIFSCSLGDHRPSLPDAQCLKNHHFIYFAQLLVGSDGLVYSALLINPSCSEGNM